MSRWYAADALTVVAGETVVPVSLQTDMRLDDLSTQLAALPRDGARRVEIEETAQSARFASLAVNGPDICLRGGTAAESELLTLARDLLTAITTNPSEALADLLPSPLCPIEGDEPPDLCEISAPLLSACIDMTTGAKATPEQMEQRVSALAAALQAAGAGAGTVVGVALPRGIDCVAAWLAILRLGAAFVQIDPDLPLEQRRHMIAEAEPAILVIDSAEKASELGGTAQLLTVPVRTDHTAFSPPPIDPAAPAYLIFTSGSTGKPKAVMISHAALDHHARAAAATFALTPADRVLAFAATTFDVAIEEIVPTIRAGATLILRSDAMLDTLERFVDDLHDQQITVLNLPTAFWRLLTGSLAQPGSRGLPPSLRLVVVGGERVPSATLAQWRTLAPDIVWMNAYGPTETTVTATVHRDLGAPLDTDSVPIGAPLGAARLALIAPDGSPAPNGRPGELWIGGPGVGLGYINRDDQTAARFRTLPGAAGAKDPRRWYRTGDRCRPLPGGGIEFIDRMDRQLKLSGYRIEPGGIEAALTSIPGVTEARVAIHHGALAVWVAGTAQHAAVMSLLLDELPPGVSPRLVMLPEMPRNTRDKLDETALRALLGTRLTSAAKGEDTTTAEVARIMGALLGQAPLDADKSFFDEGGNSLLAIELSEQLRPVLGSRPTLPAIYNHPTPRGLTQVMLHAPGRSEESLIAIQPVGTGTPMLGIHVLGTNGEFYQPLAAAFGQRHPVWGLTVGLIDSDTPNDINGAASRYFDRIQKFRPTGPLALGGVSLGAFVAFEVASRLARAGRDIQLVAIFDADGPAPSRRSTLNERLARVLGRFRDDPWAALRRYGSWLGGELSMVRHVTRLRINRMLGRQTHYQKLDEFIAANILSVAAYRPPVYSGRVVIFASQDDLANLDRVTKSALGWAAVAPNHRFECVPGDHLGILGEPGVSRIAQVICDELEAVTPPR